MAGRRSCSNNPAKALAILPWRDAGCALEQSPDRRGLGLSHIQAHILKDHVAGFRHLPYLFGPQRMDLVQRRMVSHRRERLLEGAIECAEALRLSTRLSRALGVMEEMPNVMTTSKWNDG